MQYQINIGHFFEGEVMPIASVGCPDKTVNLLDVKNSKLTADDNDIEFCDGKHKIYMPPLASMALLGQLDAPGWIFEEVLHAYKICA